MTSSLNQFYKAIAVSKQNIHQQLDRQMQADSIAEHLYHIVVQIRVDHPTLSCRAMYYKLQPKGIGRDKFESLCSDWDLVQQRPVNRARTTFSSGVIRFDNLLKDYQVTAINQAFVSDITYYDVNNVFYYITFILDAFTRYIVGYAVSKRLTTEQTTLKALQMAITYKKGSIKNGCIFHSDGGGQYYDKAFLNLTKQYKFKNSMCEYAYENGKAERINGIIKNNYLKHRNIQSFIQLEIEVDRSVALYNNERSHKNLQYNTPAQLEKQQLYLHKPTKPVIKESLHAKSQIIGASSPYNTEPTKPINQDVLTAINKYKKDK
jgi:transposase InsO family protein